MPSMMGSLVQGFKNYKKGAALQLRENTVALAYDAAVRHGKSRGKAVAAALAGGAGTFLAPPVVIGAQAVKDYRQKQRAEEQRHKVTVMTNCLKSHGISQYGAAEMANQVITGRTLNNSINVADFKMWMVVASVIEPGLAEFTPRIAARIEPDNKTDDETAKSELEST